MSKIKLALIIQLSIAALATLVVFVALGETAGLAVAGVLVVLAMTEGVIARTFLRG